MIEAVADRPDLIIGNYKTEDHPKEWAESQIAGYLLGVFANHPLYSALRGYFGYFDENEKRDKEKDKGKDKNRITRVRTEFWGMKRSFFETFFSDPNSENFSLVDEPHIGESDPTLQFVLSAILHKRVIKVVDLGRYETKAGGGNPMDQLKRVAPVVRVYRERFKNWP